VKLNVATCQFPTSGDINANLDFVLTLMREAKTRGGDVAHFPEACLSGYAGSDIETNAHVDWPLLVVALHKVLALAGSLRLWVVLGSAHRLTPPNKPHNSLYIINDEGQVVDRYDKRFLSGDISGSTGDLAHYSPGNHFSVFDIKGVRCGALICVDCRFPELYRGYKRRGVQLMFHSFHAAHINTEKWSEIEGHIGAENHALNPATTFPGITQPAMMHAAAGSNHMWISCPNSAAFRSCWPGFFVRPDGVITGRLDLHESGVLLSLVDTEARFYDSTVAWRERAMDGILHSGDLVTDTRSDDRTAM
jgi:deaminated glutathione amidase